MAYTIPDNYHNKELAQDFFTIFSLPEHLEYFVGKKRRIETASYDLPSYYGQHKTLNGVLDKTLEREQKRLEWILRDGTEKVKKAVEQGCKKPDFPARPKSLRKMLPHRTHLKQYVEKHS